jgi:hypothetical protein
MRERRGDQAWEVVMILDLYRQGLTVVPLVCPKRPPGNGCYVGVTLVPALSRNRNIRKRKVRSRAIRYSPNQLPI